MLRSLAKNSAIYYMSNILTKGISFFLLPLYTSILSESDYGVLQLISLLTSAVIILFTFQLGQGVARYYNELTSESEIKIYTSTIAFFVLGSFLVYLVISFLSVGFISDYVGLDVQTTTISLVSVALNGLFYLSQNQLAWKIKPVQEIISGLIYNLTTIGLTIYFLVWEQAGVSGIFIAQSVGALVGIGSGYLFTSKDYGFYFSVDVLKKLLFFSVPLIPGALSIFIFAFSDRICIKEMLDMNQLGIYSVGDRIATILTFTSLGVSAALSPLIYKHYKESTTPDKIGLLFRIFSSLSFIVLAFISFFSEEIILLMTNENYMLAAKVVPFLLVAIYFNSFVPFFPGLYLGKKTMLISLIAVCTGILNVALNIWLIPFYGIEAAAAVTAFSFGLNFLLLYYFSQKEFKVTASVFPVLLIVFTLFLVLYAINYFQLSLLWNVVGFLFCALLSLRIVLRQSDYIFIKEKISELFLKKTITKSKKL